MSRLTSKEWIDLTRRTIEFYNSGHLRMGQSYMNALANVNLSLYEEITATDYDCFYNDKKIINFMYFINHPEIIPEKHSK